MKITNKHGNPGALRVDQTKLGDVYFYKNGFDVFVIRTSCGADAKFICLETGDNYEGKDGHLFAVDAELVIR